MENAWSEGLGGDLGSEKGPPPGEALSRGPVVGGGLRVNFGLVSGA